MGYPQCQIEVYTVAGWYSNLLRCEPRLGAATSGQLTYHFCVYHVQGARPLAPGMKCVGNAVTVRFVPIRPDIVADKPQGEDSPE